MIRRLLKIIVPKRIKESYVNRKKNTRYLKIIGFFSKWINGFKKYVFIIFSSSKLSSSLYYFLFSGSFHREHKHVLRGKIAYLRSLDNPISSQPLLRRNTHRLEKGLLMRPRRSVFALDYISETVDAFERVLQLKNGLSSSVDRHQMKWSYDVLEEYFEVVSNHELINKERNKFQNIEKYNIDTDATKYIPYKRLISEKRKKIPSFKQFLELSEFRRSVRWFKDKKIPREIVDKAIQTASYAPSACNRQPYEFRVIDDPNLISKVAVLPNGTTGYNHNIPMIIVVVGKLDAYFSERDRHLIYIDSSLACMSLIFALETLELSSCCINWPDIERLEKQMEDILELKDYERPVMCLAVGYPDEQGMVAYSKKKDLNSIRRYN